MRRKVGRLLCLATIVAGGTASVTFAKHGSYTYIDKDHPFAFGQVNVQ